ncbi:hypothetical protein V7111_19460, partial [Neobacillus niacini]|uniref:hypothetical protein n=1 Tax=Neobacillus niacini TaxID=86668 RepID=UPI0030030F4B
AAAGEKAYNDTNAVFGKLPNYLVNGDYVYAPNADANYAADDFIKFIAGRDINVYVAYDDRIKTKPAWLTVDDLMEDGISKRGLVDTGDNITIGSATYSIYGIQLYKGEGITLGSNKGLQSEEGNLFIVFAKETRLIDKFLYDDFEMQMAGEDPEGWIVSARTGTSAKIVNVPGSNGAITNAIHLVDTVAPDLALISRKFSPLTTGKYSVKWKMRENDIGKAQQYLRILLHDGPPKVDFADSSGFVVESYLHNRYFMYRTKAGDSKTNTNIAPVAVNTWHDIELVIDMDSKTFRTYVNGVLTKDVNGKTDLPFTNTSKTKIDHIVLGTQGNGQSDIYLDDVSIEPLSASQPQLSIDNISDVAGMAIGSEVTRTVKVNPTDAALVVKSSNDGISAVSINNKVLTVRGIAEGTATVTVTASRGDLTPVKTTFTVNVKGDTAGSTVMVNETFENQTIGTLPENWNVVANKNTSALVKDLNGKRVLHLLDNNTDATNNNVFASFPISPAQTGKMAFEYKVLNNDPSVQYIRAVLTSGGDNTDDQMVVETYLHQGGLVYRHPTSGNNVTTLISKIDWSEWHKVRYEVDFATKTFDVYFDDVLVFGGKGLSFKNLNLEKIDHLILGAGGKHKADIYFDDIKVESYE